MKKPDILFPGEQAVQYVETNEKFENPYPAACIDEGGEDDEFGLNEFEFEFVLLDDGMEYTPNVVS